MALLVLRSSWNWCLSLVLRVLIHLLQLFNRSHIIRWTIQQTMSHDGRGRYYLDCLRFGEAMLLFKLVFDGCCPLSNVFRYALFNDATLVGHILKWVKLLRSEHNLFPELLFEIEVKVVQLFTLLLFFFHLSRRLGGAFLTKHADTGTAVFLEELIKILQRLTAIVLACI